MGARHRCGSAPGRAPGTAGARRRAAPRSRTASRARSAARRGSDPVPLRAGHRRRASAWGEACPRSEDGAAAAAEVVAVVVVQRAPALLTLVMCAYLTA